MWNLTYNLRLLRKNLSFVAVCVLVMALGIALSITMYSTITTVAYQALPYPDGDKYVALHKLDRDTGFLDYSGFDNYTYQYFLQTELQNFKTFGGVANSNVTLSDGEIAEQFYAANISPSLLQVTAVEPLLGRGLLASDDQPGAELAALISYEVWQNYYAGRVDIVGLTSRIDGRPYTIVGVMPQGFTYPTSHQLWLPLQAPSNAEPTAGRNVELLGILANDASLESAAVEANSLMLQLSERLPEYYSSSNGAAVLPYTRAQVGLMMTFHMLTAMTVIMLLLVCLNVTNLLVVRTNERVEELAIRSALGATRWWIIQAVLLDSLLICLLSSLFGIVLADMGMQFIHSIVLEAVSVSRSSLPFWMVFDWDLSTAFTAILITLIIWLFSGGLAAWQVFRQDINIVLESSSGKSAAKGKMIGSAILVSFETIFSFFLLVLCGVLIGTTTDRTNVNYGTATEGYLTGRVSLPASAYPDSNSQELYRQSLQQELLKQTGIEAVSFVTALPSQYGIETSYTLEDRDLFVDGQYPNQGIIQVTPDYFEVMAVPLLAGRAFNVTDTGDSQQVAIINAAFATQMWGDQSNPEQASLGQRIQINPQFATAEWLTIVGVTTHIVQSNPQDGRVNLPSIYRPISQNSPAQTTGTSFSIVLKVDGIPESYRQALQLAAVRVDRDIPISNISNLTDVLTAAGAAMGFLTQMFSNISFVALVLAVTGIYAIVSRSVRQRTREIGIRRALGSSNGKVLWVFIRQGLNYLFIGLVIGGGGAVLASNAMASIFVGLENWLPGVFIAVSLGLGMLIFVASYNPARKLIALEPGIALRNE